MEKLQLYFIHVVFYYCELVSEVLNIPDNNKCNTSFIFVIKRYANYYFYFLWKNKVYNLLYHKFSIQHYLSISNNQTTLDPKNAVCQWGIATHYFPES